MCQGKVLGLGEREGPVDEISDTSVVECVVDGESSAWIAAQMAKSGGGLSGSGDVSEIVIGRGRLLERGGREIMCLMFSGMAWDQGLWNNENRVASTEVPKERSVTFV